jgi:cation-transporting ATPase 13A1
VNQVCLRPSNLNYCSCFIRLDLYWRTVDDSKMIPVDPSEPLDLELFKEYDICITGAAMKQYESRPSWNDLVQNTWVYARVSPAQKELILTTLKTLGYTTLMAGDGTNDVGALKQAHIGVALLDGTTEDLQKIAERFKLERVKKVYESQLKISARFGQPPPPVPAAIAHLLPEAVAAQQQAAAELQTARKKNPMEKVGRVFIALSQVLMLARLFQFDLAAITDKMAEMEGDDEVPKIKLGDASCAAPFTSKLGHVAASKLDTPPKNMYGLFIDTFQLRTLFVKDVAPLLLPSRCTRFWP